MKRISFLLTLTLVSCNSTPTNQIRLPSEPCNRPLTQQEKVLPVVVQPISAGNGSSFAITADHTLWAFGNNLLGQLGDGTTTNRLLPLKVQTGVRFVSSHNHSTLAIRTDGSLWVNGNNSSGQLGTGNTQNQFAPSKTMTDVVMVAQDQALTVALRADGTLCGFGRDEYGAFGGGTLVDHLSPVRVMSGVKDMALAGGALLVLKQDNTLWAAGQNSSGQLGDGSKNNRTEFKQVLAGVKDVVAAGGYVLALRNNNTLWNFGSYAVKGGTPADIRGSLTPVQIAENVIRMATDGNSHFAVDATDNLWGWGNNFSGQLGNGGQLEDTPFSKAQTQILMADTGQSLSAGHGLFMKLDRSLWASGANFSGQLGNNSTTASLVPIKVLDDLLLPEP